MSRSLCSRPARARIHTRIDRLSPESLPIWGALSAGRMVCHVADQLRVALGDSEVRPGRIAVRLGKREHAVNPAMLRFKPVRYLLVHWLPWPKARIGAPPEMWRTAPSNWQKDIYSLHDLVDRVGDRLPSAAWGRHPWFGVVSGQEWGSTALTIRWLVRPPA